MSACVETSCVALAAGRAPLQDFLRAGNPAPVLRAAVESACAGGSGVLALVLETEGSTYARQGAMALFAAHAQVGWLSGGCLEPEIAQRAASVAASGRIAWIEVDTRDDEDLLSGSALGCRGRLRIALLPLSAMPGIAGILDAWLDGGSALQRHVCSDGTVALAAGSRSGQWQVPADDIAWHAGSDAWVLPLQRPPEALLLGAGPETPVLLRTLHDLGWRSTLVERRERWRDFGDAADSALQQSPAGALAGSTDFDAALVMHHNFELDRDALEALACSRIPFVGLLGPRRRRDDLFKLLAPTHRDALLQRLHAPVGLDLGGQGPEAIAISIAAQLQDWRARSSA